MGVKTGPAIAARAFSKTIAMTYVGLAFFSAIFFISSLSDFQHALASRSLWLLILCVALFNLGIGFLYVTWALRQRRQWARHAAVSFWALCLIWTAVTMVRNGLHPPPAAGPFQYSNADQVAGARFAALAMPYLLAIVESAAIYCLLRKGKVVNQFRTRGSNQ